MLVCTCVLSVLPTGCARLTRRARAPEAGIGTARPLGRYDCVARAATARPPRPTPPMRRRPKERAKGEERAPALSVPLCPQGQVPVARPAVPNVPKGNPLFGPVERRTEDFFRAPEEQRKVIRDSLRPMDEVYYEHPGGKRPRKPLADPPGCNGSPYYGSCFYYASAAYARRADGGGMTATIERPAYDGSGGPGHTLDEIAVHGGSALGDIVEVGWNVSTSQYSDANPHLFVFHWINSGPTCYDACNWQQYSTTYFPGMDLSTLVGREAYLGYVYFQGNWWAWFDNQWLGYFPGSEWSGAYTNNDLIQWFGEVASLNGIPPHTDMGNGVLPGQGTPARNSTLCDVNAGDWVCWVRNQQSLGATFPAYYDVQTIGFGAAGYGGPGE
jgi:hypothetical protein